MREFGISTDELRRMITYFKEHSITSFVMEATGIYWIRVFEMLASSHLPPHLGECARSKGVKGRPKTDRANCIWLCRLHQYELRRSSFVPTGKIRAF